MGKYVGYIKKGGIIVLKVLLGLIGIKYPKLREVIDEVKEEIDELDNNNQNENQNV